MLTKLAGCVDIGDNVDADQPRRGEGQTALGHAGAPHTVAVIKRKRSTNGRAEGSTRPLLATRGRHTPSLP